MIASMPALAHRPYYSQVERIRLADNEIGEVRLLHGDGIFFTDPVRPLIVDAKGRLVARGPKARSIVISCSDEHECLIVDLWDERVYDLEPGSFRQGPVQPEVRDGDRTDDWDLEDGDENWGFTMREAGAREILTANLILARQSIFGVGMIAVFAAIGAFALVPFRLNHRSRRVRLFVRIILSLVGSMIFLFLVIVTFWLSMLNGLSFELWLVPTVLGAGAVWLAAGIVRRRAPRAARS
ncbi:hypothetical protein [Microvirga splendida]|uniref:Uncharacterized protein n=1 Tax=Microvirga splendida TaxID=2795727 RepID=A0ABS0XXJ6_9HYPH|nr:hypothetical protein [Microvirga splendida]MBJ6124415.1 hypothetical protein [Microvirga splendida]